MNLSRDIDWSLPAVSSACWRFQCIEVPRCVGNCCSVDPVDRERELYCGKLSGYTALVKEKGLFPKYDLAVARVEAIRKAPWLGLFEKPVFMAQSQPSDCHGIFAQSWS